MGITDDTWWIEVRGSSDELFDGNYAESDPWFGQLHLANDNGRHMYWFGDEAEGCMQFTA